MKRYSLILSGIIFFINAAAQNGYRIPIQHDTAIQWSAECEKVINLTPKVSEYSLKKWYKEKLRNGSVTAYQKKDGSSFVSSYELSMPQLETQDWLKGLSIGLSPIRIRPEWYFIDKALSGVESYKFRGGVLNFAADSCCGCDDADAFRAKQILNYKNGKFSVYNVFISPLCARQTEKPPFDWYPLCNVAYNDNMERKFPGLSKDVVLLNTNEVDYSFDRRNPSLFDSVLTVYRTDIGSLIYQDILKGRLKAVDIETGKIIPAKKLMTIGMSTDTIPVYDVNDVSKIVEYKVYRNERSAADFDNIRIRQDLYFDFKNERLYSVIKSITLMQVFYFPDGKTIRGKSPFCRLE